MNNTVRGLFLFLFFIGPGMVFAQKGTLRGSVIDNVTGEPLIGVTVVVKGTTIGAISDFEGDFELKLDAGTYDLEASYVSYTSTTIAGVEIRPGNTVVLDQVRLSEDVMELSEIVIQAEVINTTETALMTLKRKSPGVMDGISSAGFRKIGDGDAGEAAQRVTGVSVEGGKYVYVRGLGDRYTKTTVNFVDVPGLDPDRNSIQIDLFPTSLIDNMVILKSFVPELPADFTGGIVNIETKDFPEEKILDISLKATYNPSMHFNNKFLNYPGGRTDYLGFDDGTRALPPAARQETIPSPISGDPENEVFSFLREFDPNLGALQEKSFMNYSLGLTFANQIALGNGYKLGYILTGTYRSTSELYDDVFYGEYQNPIPEDEYEMVTATTQEGVLAQRNVVLGGLGGLALKTDRSKYKLNVMHLQNGESRAVQITDIFDNGSAPGKSGYTGFSDNLEYNQRSLTHLLLHGTHVNDDASWKVEWKAASTFSALDDPDIRKTAFTILRSTGDSVFVAGAAGNPKRIWRSLDEVNAVGKVDVLRDHEALGNPAKLKFGLSYVYKERDYEILDYDIQFFGTQGDYRGIANNVMKEENLWPNGSVYVSSGVNFPNPNAYNSNVNNSAAYVSYEFTPLSNLRSILGVRGEYYLQKHTGRDVEYANTGSTGNNLDNEPVLDAIDLLPLVNFIYAVREDQNLRLSYSRTIARPSFKELSFAQILDPVSNRIFNGGLFVYDDWNGNLSETRIDNVDLRWEMFMGSGQLLSVSAFYKYFTDPIELVRIPQAQTTNEFQPRNVGKSNLFGFELEVRKNLEFVGKTFKNIDFSGNFTFVRSSLKMTETEFRSRKNFEKVGETVEDTREMAGQSPYIINAGLSYNNPRIGMEAGFFYNVKGPTLSVVGGGLFPDVYAQPFHSLNFNLNKALGSEQRAHINFHVNNILNDVREDFYTAFRSADQIFYRFSPGTEIGAGISYNF
jgi:TonB-dependent receptor